MRGARSPEAGCDFAIAAGFATWNGARERVNPRIEGRYPGHIEHDLGKIGSFTAQQRDNAFDRKFDIERRAKLAGLGIETKQPPAGFDLARFRQLHADHAAIAPCDAASADHGVEYGVPTPRHHATNPERDHSTVINGRIWKNWNSVKARRGGKLANPLEAA